MIPIAASSEKLSVLSYISLVKQTVSGIVFEVFDESETSVGPDWLVCMALRCAWARADDWDSVEQTTFCSKQPWIWELQKSEVNQMTKLLGQESICNLVRLQLLQSSPRL